MTGKVKCSCGWSWNKSDSSKKDMYVCHQCGKDNTMKNGGWLSKYNDVPEAQNGIEGTMGGLTDKGFDYNGAWGGTMQMGGSLPGAVGFTYARTQSPAPSNGKYAKKTKASALNGKEMQFYQNGLDFTPKTISEDGSVIEEDPQLLNKFLRNSKPEFIGKGVVKSREVDQAERYAKQVALTKKQAEEFKQRKLQAAAERKQRIELSAKKQETPFFSKERWKPENIAQETGAIGDKLSLQNIPYIGKYVPDILDATGAIGSMASGLGAVPVNVQQGNYGQAALSVATPLAVGALAGLGANSNGQFVNNLVNPLAGTGDLVNNLGNKYLPNVSKYNPWRFKENPNAFYRQIDDITFQEGLESGLIRGKQDIDMTQGDNIININKAFGDDAYYNKGSLYYKNNKNLPYLYEANLPEENFIPKVNGRTKKYTVDNTSVRVSKEPLSITNPSITVYKKDWLQGYKPIEIPKPTSSFKSEINWGKWNKEIPDNPQLMKEYNAIEQTSKANGSWMKNPDGSEFQGTPEQFVQQNSKNFKKAFGNSKLVNPDGSPEINYHSTYDDFNKFDISNFDKSTHDGGFAGKGHYTSSNKNWSKTFGDRTLEGYLNIENPIPNEYNHFFGREGMGSNPEFGRFNMKDKFGKYDGVIYGVSNYKFNERVFNNPSSFKSATGNNGMFDMTNPNIYKSIVPGAIGLGAASQIKQKREGGVIKDDMGQYNHPGEITEIGSNQITMEGVPYPVLGISDTGDTQMMYPEQDYQFNGESVTEIPMMQKGGNVDPGYGEPDYVTGTSRRTLNKMAGIGNYLIPASALNSAADLAKTKGLDYGESTNGPADAVRHTSAAASVASKLPIPKIIGEYYPTVDRALRVVGSNILGGAYELVNPNSEGLWMDLKNNYEGSLIGSLSGLKQNDRNKMIISQLQKGKLTVDNPKKPKKENGGWLNKYN